MHRSGYPVGVPVGVLIGTGNQSVPVITGGDRTRGTVPGGMYRGTGEKRTRGTGEKRTDEWIEMRGLGWGQ